MDAGALGAARWRRLRPLLDELLELEGDARPARLEQIARDEPELSADLQRLLVHHDRTAGIDRTDLGEAIVGLRAELLQDGPMSRAGPWQLETRVGVGGMGEVWRAHRVEGGYEQVAALKLVRAGIESELLRTRFELERRILARLEHPAIARLLDGGRTEDGRPYFAMEFVDGEPINVWVERTRPGTDDLLRLFVQICDAVDYAHRNLIVHRDLKPSNILVDGEGRPRLLDFGIAKLLDEEAEGQATQFRALTPAYAAPEQFAGSAVTTATDVYALGLILYEAIAGVLPVERSGGAAFDALAQVEVHTGPVRRQAERQSEQPPRLRHLGRDLDAIVLNALRRDSARRYPSAAALAEDLRRLLEGQPVSARPDTFGYRVRRFVGRHRSAVTAATVALLALLSGFGVALWQAQLAHQTATRLEAEMRRAEAESRRAELARDFLIELVEAGNPNLVGGDARRTVREMLLSAAEKLDARLTEEPLAQAELRLAVARALRAHGEPGPGLSLVDAAMLALDREVPPDPVLLGAALQTRASFRAGAGDYSAAEVDVQRALGLFRSVPDHPGVQELQRAARSTLALIYNATARQREALDLRREDLAERSRALGADHPDLAPAWYNLGFSNYRADRFEEARLALLRSEAIMSAAGGEQAVSPRRVYVWLMLAQALAAGNRFGEAESWLARTEATLDAGLAQDRPDLRVLSLHTRLNVAWLGGQRAEALAVGARLWAQFEADPSADLGYSALHWATVLLAEGRETEAEAVVQRGLAQSQARRGAEDPLTLQLQAAALITAHRRHGRAEDLAALVQLAADLRLADSRRPLGQLAAWLAQALQGSDPEAAVRWGSEADAALRSVYGADHPWTRSRAGTLAR